MHTEISRGAEAVQVIENPNAEILGTGDLLMHITAVTEVMCVSIRRRKPIRAEGLHALTCDVATL